MNNNQYYMEYNYEMPGFDQNNIELMLQQMGLSTDFMWTMTEATMLDYAIFGSFAGFKSQNCIINFSEWGLILILLSRLNAKKVTGIIRIPKSDISLIKVSNILVSYNLKIKFAGGTLKFQLFKVVGGMKKQKENIAKFRNMYNC